MRRLAIFMVVQLLLMYSPVDCYADENESDISLYAQSAVLMDAGSGRVLYEKNGDEQLPMASTTKIMTLIVTLETADISEIVTVSKYASTMPDVQLNMREGEQYYLKDLLYSLMLESHNDSAVAIAEHVSGSVEEFAKLMNQKARDIGCENTNFVTPNGLDRNDANGNIHATTARDLSRIMSYCVEKSPKKEEFLEITRTKNYSFADIAGTRNFSCNNHNAFLTMMEGALSGKTGFTGAAGYCYVGALRRDGKTFVVSLLACGWPNHKTYKWRDTRELMEYGLEHYEVRYLNEIQPEDDRLKPIRVWNGQTDEIGGESWTGLVLTQTNRKTPEQILMKPQEKIEIVYDIEKELEAPVRKGEKVGEVSYLLDGNVVRFYTVVASNEIKRIDFRWCFSKVWNKFTV